MDVFFTPYIGKLSRFSDLVAHPTENLQDNILLAIAQASGSGKTKLCFAIGSDPSTAFYSVFIRFCEISDSSTKRLVWLIRAIEDNILGKEKQAERSLHLFRLWIFAHVEWAMLVANHARHVCVRYKVERQIA